MVCSITHLGERITTLRTAGMSGVAARSLARANSEQVAFIGCGDQARAHLTMLRHILPGLCSARAYSRSVTSTQRFCAHAHDLGVVCRAVLDPRDAVRDADIVVSTVPGAPGLAPFLDAAWLKPGAFVAAVDTGRSWQAEGLRSMVDVLACEDTRQWTDRPFVIPHLSVIDAFDCDLGALASGAHPGRKSEHEITAFIFQGHGAADLCVASELASLARARGAGLLLPR